jgi:hypothetical protein
MQASLAELRAVVDGLVAVPLDALPVGELQEHVAALGPELGRLTGLLRAAESALEQACGGEVPTPDGGRRPVAGWLAQVHRQTASACGRDLRVARALRTMPLVQAAVLDGRLTPAQAGVLSRFVGRIDADALHETQEQLVTVAAPLDPVALAAWVSHEIATHCEPAFTAEQTGARARRYLQTRRQADGSLAGRFLLAAEDSEALLTLLEPLARRAGDTDTRTAGQRRADALVDICGQVLRFGALPDSGGQRAQLSYVLPADWAARQHDRERCPACGPVCPDHQPPSFTDTVTAAQPGMVGVPAEHSCATGAWSGPQTRARIESVLCDARITRVLLDPTGQVIRLESLTDQVTTAQRRALAARDLGCSTRGCTRPPAMCDAHHLQHRQHGGPTSLGNLVLLCRYHHLQWHLGRLRPQHLHIPWHPDHARPAITTDQFAALISTPA